MPILHRMLLMSK